jgi:hypothetical protein
MVKINMKKTKEQIIKLMETMMAEGIISHQDLTRFIPAKLDPYEPESVRQEMENWYNNLGIEAVIGHKLSLSPCPFSREEIARATQNNEIILCQPGGLSKEQIGRLFRIECWALNDPLVKSTSKEYDFWCKTLATLEPPEEYRGLTAEKIRRIFSDEGKIGFTLELYLIFIARMRHLRNETPDKNWWIWLLNTSYDDSGYLVAGFDLNRNFNAHGWMPKFSARFVGARFFSRPQKRT